MKEARKRIWIDSFQTGLLIRIVAYCVLYQVASWAINLLFELINGGFRALGAESYVYSSVLVRSVLTLLVLVPPLTLDAIRFAHRLIGPLYRFRKTIQAITAGEPIPLVHLRKNDMLMDLKDDFNAMLRHLEQIGAIVIKTPESGDKTASVEQEKAALSPG